MNMEKLLGKLLQEAVGGQFGNAHDRQQHKKSSNDSLLGSLTSQLASGKGLMTAIGLGVGAYEVFRTSGQRQQGPPQPNWGTVPPAPGTSASPPPPPPGPTPAQTPPAAPPAAAAPSGGDQDFACRLIRVMIAAAHADGTLDAEEERSILDRLRSAELSQEEKMFLLEELHHPRSIAELTEGISSLRLTQAMYAVALSAIKVDTESERRWLDELGAALGLSEEIRRFIEETR
ncbi:DUF533 domain-containing protein [Candidatus Electronema sp. TJ]|uniref:DUF533 domain-containing protein n=1 Tax=Candidatus Electronema sp. TJ TaxID=3401573 RepID=UPI003AA81721